MAFLQKICYFFGQNGAFEAIFSVRMLKLVQSANIVSFRSYN